VTDIVLSDEARRLILELVKKKPGFEKTPWALGVARVSMQLLILLQRNFPRGCREGLAVSWGARVRRDTTGRRQAMGALYAERITWATLLHHRLLHRLFV